MSKSSEVDGGGTATVAPTRSADASPEVVLIDKGGGAVPEGAT